MYDWAGFYVGGHVGGSWSNQGWTNTANTTVFGDLAPRQGFGQQGSGVFGGAQIGYNWQASNYVFGLEGTISGMDNRGTLSNTIFGAGDDVFSWRNNWMATITARAGFAVNNNLFYAKGGYAGVNSHLAVSDVLPPAAGSGSDDQWHNGWTVGAGWEYGITQNWIFGLEYDYAAFEARGYQLGSTFGSYAFDAKRARHPVRRRPAELQVQRSAGREVLTGREAFGTAKYREAQKPRHGPGLFSCEARSPATGRWRSCHAGCFGANP